MQTNNVVTGMKICHQNILDKDPTDHASYTKLDRFSHNFIERDDITKVKASHHIDAKCSQYDIS